MITWLDTLRLYRFRRLLRESEAHAAQAQLEKHLLRIFESEGLRWSDLQAQWKALYDAIPQNDRPDEADFRATWDIPPDPPDAPPPEPPPNDVNVLDLTVHMIQEHVHVTNDEALAIALWILHTWVFSRYDKTPRLALISVEHNCGKSTLLRLCERLTREARLYANISAAALFSIIDQNQNATLLLDEADNADLPAQNIMRAVLNAGYDHGGTIVRRNAQETVEYRTHCPVAIAAIQDLPTSLLSRSIVIPMHRAPSNIKLRRLDPNYEEPGLMATCDLISRWARTCDLNPDPELPKEFRTHRIRDNWRPLIAIADALGHGDDARAVAIRSFNDDTERSRNVILLDDIRTIFRTTRKDRIASGELVSTLKGGRFEGDYRGLSNVSMAKLLRPMGICPQQLWDSPRLPSSKCFRGYLKTSFERAWATYLDDDPSHPSPSSKIKTLRRHGAHP